MNIDYGFVEFFDKEDDKMMSSFFKEANNRDILGLRKMNVRISNVLFPFGNTLMPNLVYFYYLNAIYHAFIEVNKRTPTGKNMDKYEILISQKISKDNRLKKKGFFDNATNRAYGKYKSSMKRMKFFQPDWKAHSKLEKTALESLKETERYQYVKNIMENKLSKDDEWPENLKPDRLDDIERLDFIRRVVRPYEEERPQYSVFANIVMYHAKINNKPSKSNETIYRDDYWVKKYIPGGHLKQIEEFDNMENYFNDIVKGGETDIHMHKNRKEDYEIARVYSRLQLIAKLTYNICLFEKVAQKYEEYRRSLLQEVEAIRNESCLETWGEKNFKGKKYDIFLGVNPGDEERDEILVNAFDFIREVAACITNAGANSEDKMIESLKELVKNREYEIMGDNSILNSGIIASKGMADYVDTFRWQYRPEYAYEEAEEAGEVEDPESDDEELENEKKGYVWYAEDKEHKYLKTMSASYYIYELFFEPYEEIGDTDE